MRAGLALVALAALLGFIDDGSSFLNLTW